MVPRARPSRVSALVLLATSISACSTHIPNISPFAEQTAKMSAGVQNGFTQAQSLLSQTDVDSSLQDRLNREWAQTRSTLNAMVAYSAALVELAQAGATGKAAANTVVGALEGVVSALGAGPIAGPVTAALAEVNNIIARMRAREKLKDLINEAQPAIDTIASIIAQNLTTLEQTNDLVGRDVQLAHDTKHQRIVNYYEGLIEEDGRIIRILTLMLERRAALYLAQTADTQEVRDRERRRAEALIRELKKFDQNVTAENFDDRHEYWLGMSRSLKNDANRYRPDYEAYVARRKEIDALRLGGNAIIRKSRAAVLAWARAHRQLRDSFNEKLSFVNLIDFATAVQEVIDAYQEN